MNNKIPQTKLIKVTSESILKKLRNNRGFHYSEDGFIECYSFSHHYIGDVISQDHVKQWLINGNPICIAAPTGTGKSSLVFDSLLQTAQDMDCRICILGSRTALMQKYKYEAAKCQEPDLLKELTPKGFRTRHRFGLVDVYSYQEMESILLTNPINFFRDYGVIVLDECHFFVQDSPFNEYTQEVLERIIQFSQNCVRLYLTATPDIVLDEMVKYEKRYSTTTMKDITKDNCFYQAHTRHLVLYYFDINYDYIKPCFFREEREIIEVIKSDSNTTKYLICVDSIPRGQALLKELGSEAADFIDAEQKNTTKADEVDSMISNEKFSKRILIATSFLDVGINLTDESLTNIVIYSTSQTHFIQSIGRKRRQDHQNINLYIHVPALDEINKCLKIARYRKSELTQNVGLYCGSGPAYFRNLPESIYMLKGKNDIVSIKFNGLAFTYWSHRIEELNNMLDSLDKFPNSHEAFSRYYLHWLGLEHLYEQAHWLGKTPDTANQELILLVEHYVSKKLAKDTFTQFRKEFAEVYNRIYPQKQIRCNRLPHLNKLNTLFSELGLPFIASNEGNTTYTIKKG